MVLQRSVATAQPHISHVNAIRIGRLLGTSVAQDILHLSNSLYSEGGGRAQVVVNDLPNDSGDFIDAMFLVSCP